MRLWATLIATLTFVAGPAQADRLADMEARMQRLERALAERPKAPGAYALPKSVSFCGETVDLTDPWIRERLEKELLLVLGDRAQIALWTKRAGRVFPVIEAQAATVGTCADLKYVAVVESGLRPAVTSRASARGWWQFMSGTARQYGLAVDNAWDERADLASASQAGLSYLKALRGRFGSWPLAMAAYNTGPGRLSRAQKAQGLTDFWSLDLYSEAERYVPRIIAVKTVLSNPNHYNLALRPADGWARRPVGFVKVRVAGHAELSVADAAKAAGVPLRVLRQLNPEMSGDTLPTGRTLTLEVPRGKERAMRDWLAAESARQQAVAKKTARARKRRVAKKAKARGRRAPAKAKARSRRGSRASAKGRSGRKAPRKKSAKVYYRVRRGDSLWDIAQAKKVSVADIRRWNGLGRRSVITPGQRLVVRRAKR